jgi:hypothetical protein
MKEIRIPKDQDLFTIQELPAILRMKLVTVRYHIYNAGDLVASRRYGRTPLFTRKDIADFLQRKRPAHRPPSRHTETA